MTLFFRAPASWEVDVVVLGIVSPTLAVGWTNRGVVPNAWT